MYIKVIPPPAVEVQLSASPIVTGARVPYVSGVRARSTLRTTDSPGSGRLKALSLLLG